MSLRAALARDAVARRANSTSSLRCASGSANGPSDVAETASSSTVMFLKEARNARSSSGPLSGRVLRGAAPPPSAGRNVSAPNRGVVPSSSRSASRERIASALSSPASASSSSGSSCSNSGCARPSRPRTPLRSSAARLPGGAEFSDIRLLSTPGHHLQNSSRPASTSRDSCPSSWDSGFSHQTSGQTPSHASEAPRHIKASVSHTYRGMTGLSSTTCAKPPPSTWSERNQHRKPTSRPTTPTRNRSLSAGRSGHVKSSKQGGTFVDARMGSNRAGMGEAVFDNGSDGKNFGAFVGTPAGEDLADLTNAELREEAIRLRHAFMLAGKCVDGINAEVAIHRSLLEENEAQQAMEESRQESLLEALVVENKKFQVGARNGWNVARKLQAALRLHEERLDGEAEELAETQRRLEQENARLRKESAAMRTRLLGWRQMERKVVGSERHRAALAFDRSFSPTYSPEHYQEATEGYGSGQAYECARDHLGAFDNPIGANDCSSHISPDTCWRSGKAFYSSDMFGTTDCVHSSPSQSQSENATSHLNKALPEASYDDLDVSKEIDWHQTTAAGPNQDTLASNLTGPPLAGAERANGIPDTAEEIPDRVLVCAPEPGEAAMVAAAVVAAAVTNQAALAQSPMQPIRLQQQLCHNNCANDLSAQLGLCGISQQEENETKDSGVLSGALANGDDSLEDWAPMRVNSATTIPCQQPSGRSPGSSAISTNAQGLSRLAQEAAKVSSMARARAQAALVGLGVDCDSALYRPSSLALHREDFLETPSSTGKIAAATLANVEIAQEEICSPPQ